MPDLVPKSLAAKMVEWKAAAKAWKPHPYQARALKFMLGNPWSGLLLDPGLGKTSITLADLKVLFAKKLARRALIVAPLRAIYDVWPPEARSWSDFQGMGIALLHGPGKDKVLRDLKSEHRLCLINPEGVQWLTAKKERLRMLDADVLIIDESSRFKSSTSVRFRCLRKHLIKFKRRHILTGSPRPKSYLDLFGQVYLMDRGAALGEYISHYRNTFFFPTGFQMREWEILPGAAEQIDKLIAPMVLRLDAQDYLKLPKVMERTHYVELPPKVRAEYDKIEENLIGELFSQPFVNSAASRSRCAQIANGAVYLDAVPDDAAKWGMKERRVKFLHTEKVDALVDLYDELQGEPLLVSIGYHHDVAAICKALGKNLPCINGATTRTQASDYIERWNKGLLPLMMIHPASAGHALNLQKFSARHVAFFNIPDDYDHYDQAFRRVWRQGNKAAFVMRHNFIARATVDVPKMRNLLRKATGQKAFLDAMKQYALERYGRI